MLWRSFNILTIATEHAKTLETQRCYACELIDQKSKSPPYLVSFVRKLESFFYDISEYSDTQLTEIEWITNEDEDGDGDGERKEKLGYSQISRARRQCVVLLRPDLYHDRVERQWLFQIRGAEFRLLPGTTRGRSEAQLTKERLAFARNTNNDGTIERTLQQLGTLDLQSKGLLVREPHSTWFRTSPKREKDKVIRIKSSNRLEEAAKVKCTRLSTCIPARTTLAKSST
ncbi:hypothetical protein NW765_013485 [Fusarium oxysporum]|nr:hypothetical protein NW765_013485 [Fusarium oxysporum]